jgi:hypothetical protein
MAVHEAAWNGSARTRILMVLGRRDKGAMTGLALLCFPVTGNERVQQYGLTVSKAVQWISRSRHEVPGRLHMDDSFKRNSDVYEHGICTYALGSITR